MTDILIVGGGPAGVSAALTARIRNKSVCVVPGAAADTPLWKAPEISNYPGLPGISGAALLEAFLKQAQDAGASFVSGRALSVLPMGENFGVSVGAEVYEASAVILCTGTSHGRSYPGERELLGRGVSYCATCDGMLFRGKRVAVIGLCADAPEEAAFLRSLGCEVLYFDKRAKYEIRGTDRVEALAVNGEEHPADGVFILRNAISAETLLPELHAEGGRVRADAAMRTNVPGVFAAGDCVGKPFQVAKAVGEGNIAAISASEFVERNGAKGK
jgi:thioredoxin reductase (NADPH)